MIKLIFDGWKVGARTIPFIKLLNSKAGLSLIESRKVKEDIVDNDRIVEVSLSSLDLAKEIQHKSQDLGFNCSVKKG